MHMKYFVSLPTGKKQNHFLQYILTFENSCATPVVFVQSEQLPINTYAGRRENLDIVIAGSSNLITDKAHSHPCAFSCQLNKMSHSGWQYTLFSTAVCLYLCQCKLNVDAVPSTVGMAAVAECAGRTMAGRAMQHCPCRWGLMGCSDEKTCWRGGGSVVLASSRQAHEGRLSALSALQFLFPLVLWNKVVTVQQPTSKKCSSQWEPKFSFVGLFLQFFGFFAFSFHLMSMVWVIPDLSTIIFCITCSLSCSAFCDFCASLHV